MSWKSTRSRLGVVICCLALLVGGVSLAAIQANAAVPNAAVAAAAPASGSVVLLTPCRIADSRTWTTLTTFWPYESEDQKIAENCGVPALAAGAILNITIVPSFNYYGGYLTLYPTDGVRPEVSQVTYNWSNISGEVTVKLGTFGSVTIFNGSPGMTDVIVDVAGYIAA
jgi:hypothetical protein